MKTCTPTTVFSRCLEESPSSKPRTPNSFSDCSPKRSNSSELKVKHSHEFGRILDLFRDEKRCVSVHRLNVKTPMFSSPKMGAACSRNTLVLEQSPTLTNTKPTQEQIVESTQSSLDTSTTSTSCQIQESGDFKKWIKVGSTKMADGQQGILERLNGQKKKIKINVKAFKPQNTIECQSK